MELPKRAGENTRRYIISNKGREELAMLSRYVEKEVGRQLGLLSLYSFLAEKNSLKLKIRSLSSELNI
ncbi:MAG: hypothetical protein LYZ70_01740 [Nitrososphaerales archaeon]|nr:hypothetical protein [Nitrososphaerales archaeon]